MERELRAFNLAMRGSLERVIACLEGLSEEQLNWRPPAPETNSLYVLTTHIMGNAEENILGVACGLPVERDRESEFLARGETAEQLIQQARELTARIEGALERLSSAVLDTERDHPRRGRITAREALLVAARQAAEHVGQMELTRDLAKADTVH